MKGSTTEEFLLVVTLGAVQLSYVAVHTCDCVFVYMQPVHLKKTHAVKSCDEAAHACDLYWKKKKEQEEKKPCDLLCDLLCNLSMHVTFLHVTRMS